ncbi:plasmid-related protein [plant metagenome]|uniref:Plasmid-related protein n=1 Tax=plant metagenome TaxID=1297885 RepID=A0A484U558_9ZZZZ
MEENVLPALARIRQDDLTDLPQSEGWFEAMRQAFLDALVAAAVVDEVSTELVEMVARQVDRFNAGEWTRLLRRAYGVDVLTADRGIAPLLRMWEAENIGLIRSIPNKYLDSLHGQVVAAVQRGTPLREMTAIVRNTYDVPRKRAELIARDQIGKLNGQITEHRQRTAGIDEYRWRGALDERERPEHVAREGQAFKWTDPPPDGHPGHPIRCRCWAEPVLPLLDDLDALIVH